METAGKPELKEFSVQKFIPFLFFLVGIGILFVKRHEPLRDFGNYYYGSKLYTEGRFSIDYYKSISKFNNELVAFGEKELFENYIPVPPLSLLVYAPFCLLDAMAAKLLFNVLGLLMFCFSLYKVLRHIQANSVLLLALPVIFFFPLFNNLLQGQTYLLLSALLFESYLALEKSKVHVPALLIAACISLKLFPAFILLYVLLRKNYKVAAWVLFYTGAFILLAGLATNFLLIKYYFTQIAPRLLNNEIIGPYHPSNQSVYSLLLNIFSTDAIHNPQPFIQLPDCIPFIEGLACAVFILFIVGLQQKNNLFLFGLTVFTGQLCNRYNTSYALILLIPFALAVLNENIPSRPKVLVALLLFIAFSVPLNTAGGMPLLLQFLRLIVLLLLLPLLAKLFPLQINVIQVASLSVALILFKYFSFSLSPVNYFPVQNSSGILYDFTISNNTLRLVSTLGWHDTVEVMTLPGKAVFDKRISLYGNKLMLNGHLLNNERDNKLKPFLYNDTCIVFLSDLNQGTGFYKLRQIPIIQR